MMKKIVFLLALFPLAFFVDDQVSFFLSSFTDYGWVLTSCSFAILLFYLGMLTTSRWFYPFLFVLGIFYDAYYFTTIGLAGLLFPLFFMIIGRFRPLLYQGFWERFLLMLMMMTILSMTFYLMAFGYGLTTYPITYFITFNLAPSLFLNTFYLFVLIPRCDKLFLKI